MTVTVITLAHVFYVLGGHTRNLQLTSSNKCMMVSPELASSLAGCWSVDAELHKLSWLVSRCRHMWKIPVLPGQQLTSRKTVVLHLRGPTPPLGARRGPTPMLNACVLQPTKERKRERIEQHAANKADGTARSSVSMVHIHKIRASNALNGNRLR